MREEKICLECQGKRWNIYFWTNCQKSTWIEVCKKKCFFTRACLKLINPIQNINHWLSWKYEKKNMNTRSMEKIPLLVNVAILQFWINFSFSNFGLKHRVHFLDVTPLAQWPSLSLLPISKKTERLSQALLPFYSQ